MKPGDINRTIIELSTNLRVFEKSVIATDRARSEERRVGKECRL